MCFTGPVRLRGFSVYAGVKLFGVGGIVKGPLALIVIFEIMKERAEFDERIQSV